MKRRHLWIIALAVICAFCVVFAACKKDPPDPEHKHKYSSKWSYDANEHWRVATCEHKDLETDRGEHDMEHARCTVCGYELPGGFSYTQATGSSGSTAVVLPTTYPATAATPSLMIHYFRSNSADYTSWCFWLWNKTADGAGSDYTLQYQDSTDAHGSVTIVPLSTLGVTASQTVGLIPKDRAGWDGTVKDMDVDRLLNLSEYTMDSNNYYHVYLVEGDANLYQTEAKYEEEIEKVQHGLKAEFTATNRISIETSAPVKYVAVYSIVDDVKTLIAEENTTSARDIAYNFAEGGYADLTKTYTVKVIFADDFEIEDCAVSLMKLYDTEFFNDAFYYDGELGAIYSTASTTFKVWSPVSSKIVLNIYNNGNLGSASATHEMVKGDKGVFSVTVNGDLAAKYYTYTVYNSSYPMGAEIVDPYAKSAGLNGVRGQIVDFAATNPAGWEDVTPFAYDANELTVWETHVADVTSSSTWQGTAAYRNKFLGMIESGTTYKSGSTTVTTGFDHIRDLGVNAVQLVPIFDQAGNDEADKAFNWGYNPLNYNVLEGGYSTNPYDGYTRINEFKQLVMAFNGIGVNIIMDVVYNHVNAAGGSNFDVLMPGYYYRYTSAGAPSNGSGCGNETASERLMFRKFMIDSVCFWAKEYKLGGFRFDLMGLHDLDTMEQLVAALKKVNPAIVVYGEPWTGGGTTLPSSQMASQANGSKYVGYGQFNDEFRDALIKGGMSGASEKGWATGGGTTDASAVINGLQGYTRSSIKDLYKTVNYVTCHDNYTLYDRVRATGQTNETTVRNMAMLANSVVFTSNGVNFMLAGEEFLRSKAAGGATGEQVHNSYNAGYKVNELDYQLKVDNIDIFNNYVKLIAFKQKFVDEFGLNSNDQVTARYSASASGSTIQITITAKDGKTWKIVHANGAATVNLNGYTLYMSTNGNVTLSASTSVKAYQTIIAYK